MSDDTKIDELLDRWEELREQGESISPEELCRDCPELVEAGWTKLAQLNKIRETSSPIEPNPIRSPAAGDRTVRAVPRLAPPIIWGLVELVVDSFYLSHRRQYMWL